MLLPQSRLLSVLEIIDDSSAKKRTKTDTRYPQRRNLERAAQSFVTYWLVSSLIADSAEADPGTEVDRPTVPTSTTPS